MEEQSLAISFANSLTEEVSGVAGEYAELGLDALVEDGLFKDIPIVSTAVAVYRIGQSIRERHHIAKLISFLNEINKGINIANKTGSAIMIGHVWSADVLPALLKEIYPELKSKGYRFSTVSESNALKR